MLRPILINLQSFIVCDQLSHFYPMKSAPDSIRVYSPEPLLGHPWQLLRSIACDLLAARELAWRLFVRDLSAQYRQTFLGYVWVFLPPLAASLTFIFLNSQGIVRIDTGGIPYPAFAMMGTLLWQVFVDAVTSPAHSLAAARSMLSKINFPREAILMGGLAMVVFNFFARLVLVAGVMWWWRIPIDSGVLVFPLAMAALLTCGFAIGLAITPLAGLYGDVIRAIPIIAQFWMLLTPVVYPARTEGLAGALATWNPVAPLIITARESLTAQTFTQLQPLILIFGCSLLFACLGLIGFRLAMPHLIARMGG
jgi:lipopolysaccharide transport system permease protein